MSISLVTVPVEVADVCKQLRFRKEKNLACLILKVDNNTHTVVVDHSMEGCTTEDIQDNLPDGAPRFIVITYEMQHGDGRISYPLIGLYYLPPNANDKSKMLYASGMQHVFQSLDINKIFNITEPEDLTDAFLQTLKIK